MKRPAPIGMLGNIAATYIMLLTVEASSGDVTAPVFAPRPRFLYTQQELAAWRADPGRSNELARIVARAGAALSEKRPIPDKEGQWIFYYACPLDGARLVADAPSLHRCPVCGKTYDDERTVAAWRTLVFNEIDAEVRDLGIAYGLSDDARFAQRVRDVLLRLAELYQRLPRHDRWGRRGTLAVVGGRRYSQLLDEAFGVIQLASGYDLTAPAECFTEQDRRLIEENLLKLITRDIRTFQHFIDARNNHQTWFNAACAVVGLVTGDNDLIHEAVYGRRGLMFQVESSVTDDGMWYEGAIAYHFYALSAIQITLDAARRAGWNFSANMRLRSLWEGPTKIAYPDGTLPVFHDSDRASLRNYQPFFDWAGHYFGDAMFAAMGRGDFGSKERQTSEVLRDIGLAVLRKGSSLDAVCALMDYGKHGGAHGHPDKLGIVLYALGRELALDPGRISYSVPEYRTWCRTTAAHNTVVINGTDQEETEGKLLHFEENADFASCLASAEAAYPGWRLSRCLVLTEKWLLDVFAVEGRNKSTIDCFFHCRGAVTTDVALGTCTTALKGSGYEHLRNLRSASGTPEATFIFSDEGRQPLRVRLAGDDADDGVFIVGEAMGYTINDRVPFLLRRRNARGTVFVTAYDFGGSQAAVESLEVIPAEESGIKLAPWLALGVRIITTDGTVTVGVDMRSVRSRNAGVDGMSFERVKVARDGKQTPH